MIGFIFSKGEAMLDAKIPDLGKDAGGNIKAGVLYFLNIFLLKIILSIRT